MTPLTPDEQKAYYASQNSAAEPLSPTDWKAQQDGSLKGTMTEDDPSSSGGASSSGLGNFRLALRTAMNEAGAQRMATNAGLTAPLTGGVPGLMRGVVDLVRKGAQTDATDVFSDTLKVWEDRRKEMEFNPDQYRTVQGGIYDIKNSKWVVGPKDESSGSGVATIAGVKVRSTTKQIVDGFTSLDDLTPTEQAKAKQELYALGFNAEDPPEWFRTEMEQEKQQSIFPETLKQMWAEKRSRVLFGKRFMTGAFVRETSPEGWFKNEAAAEGMSVEEFEVDYDRRIQIYRDNGFTDDEIAKHLLAL